MDKLALQRSPKNTNDALLWVKSYWKKSANSNLECLDRCIVWYVNLESYKLPVISSISCPEF